MKAEHPREHHDPALQYWGVLRRHRLAIAACFALGTLAAVVVGRLLTPVYEAKAVVMFGSGPAQMVGVGADTLDSYYERRKDYLTQPMLVTSRSVLRQVATNLSARGCDEFAGMDDRTAVTVLGGRVSVKPKAESRLMEIGYEGPKRENVAVVANELVRCFKEQNRLRSAEASGVATSWFEERLPELMKELAGAENRLYEFQKANSMVSLDKRYDTVSQRLAQLNQDVTRVERERIALEASVGLIERTGSSPDAADSLPFVRENPTLRALDAQMLALEGRKTELLRSFKADHPEVQSLDTRIGQLREQRLKETASVLAAERNRLAVLHAEEAALRGVLAAQQDEAMAVSGKMVELAARERNVERIKGLYEPMLERSRKVDLAAGLEAVPVVVIDPAEEPTGPAKPRKTLIALAGAAIGLIVGLRLAFILNRADARVRSPEDIEWAGSKPLGAIPHAEGQSDQARSVICRDAPKSAAAEACRSLRTGVLQSHDGDAGNMLLVTSSEASEGKTFVATNLAVALSQLGRKVLLVDADMRRSTVHKNIGVEGSKGLSAILSDGTSAGELVRETRIDNLFVMPAGEAPENPAELLSSPRMAEFIAWAKASFPTVLMDSPPLGAVTDAQILARLVDGVILVARAEKTHKGALARSQRLLSDTGAKVVGVTLNDIHASAGRYGHGYGYGD